MKRKIVRTIALLLASLTLLSGCGGADTSGKDSDSISSYTDDTSADTSVPTGDNTSSETDDPLEDTSEEDEEEEDDSVSSDTDNPLKDSREKLVSFDYGDVTLADGLFKDVFDGCMSYYGELTVDDILYRRRAYYGMDTKTGRDLDWGSECCIEQFISFKARRYAVTNDEKDLQTVKDILSGYQEIIDKTGVFPLINGCYLYEKLLRAFIDCYNCCGLEEGYQMAKALVSYGMESGTFNAPQKLLGDNGTEWYTMSEALYLFAALAEKKGEDTSLLKQYTDFAKLYEYTEFWDIFKNDESLFDYKVAIDHPFNKWFHAYSHFNSFNSALQAYAQTGDSYYLEAAEKFYKWAESTQKQATGGYGAKSEWLLPSGWLVYYLRNTQSSTETGCNSYAIINIDNYLMTFTGDGAYGQWTEDAFYNMTISALETKDGQATYYSDYSSDGGSKFRRSDWLWACCAGTRPLAVMQYLKSIYFNDTKNLYVNLYTNSSVDFESASGNKIKLTQSSDYPTDPEINFTVNVSKNEYFKINFRKPSWIADNAVINVNGKAFTGYKEENGWYSVSRKWKDGDTVSITLPMNLYYSIITNGDDLTSGLPYTAVLYAVKYGPVVLAAEGVVSDLSKILPVDADINTLLTKQDGTLNFTSTDNKSVKLKPYYDYDEDEEYILYINKK